MKPIKDEFSHIKCRQRRYQLRKHKQGLCDTCGTKKERYSHKCNRCMSVYLKALRKRKPTQKKPQDPLTTAAKRKYKFIPPPNDGARLLARLKMPEYYQTNDMEESWQR